MPVFLISFNRGAALKRTIAGVRGLAGPVEIIIHDNGSTDLETMEILKSLEDGGIEVFRHPAIATADELDDVNETVQAYFARRGAATRYVVSDCDIDMSASDPRALDVYAELLDLCPHIECVGPMLTIRDISRAYPLFNRVMNQHIRQFWSRTPVFEQTATHGPVAVLEATIDTTFALHRPGEAFGRMKKGLRVYEPFEARHLDWYITEGDDRLYFESSSPKISHWNNKAMFERHRNVSLEHARFFAVRTNADGGLEVYTEELPPVRVAPSPPGDAG